MGLHKVALFRFSIVTIFICVFALVALCIGVFSPAWIVLKRNGVWISEGPWYTMACPDGEGHCILSTREMLYGIHSDGRGDSPLKDEHWLAVQIESTAAVALACLSLVVIVFAFIKRSWTSVHWVQIIGGVLLLSTSILSLIAVLKVMSASKDMDTSVPWSRDITFAGSVAAFVASALYVFAISQSCVRHIKLEKIRRESSTASSSATSGCDVTNSSPEHHIQYITLDSVSDGSSLSRSCIQIPSYSDTCNSNPLPSKYPFAPPAYSEIYQ